MPSKVKYSYVRLISESNSRVTENLRLLLLYAYASTTANDRFEEFSLSIFH